MKVIYAKAADPVTFAMDTDIIVSAGHGPVAFGHVVLAWIWLDVALCARALPAHRDDALRRGKLAACGYFFHYELPRIGAWLKVVESRDATCRTMDEAWF